ncbi:gp2 [Synechococcus phage S-PM2]|uniref:Gp2 n=1 Tax=Synechococcus phage S-PM2 TaxID=238854 RepID=Q5GQD5_BPSYP|nr:gp2 [Synechococcus phage S-PM2]CAF34267.1 gp2 [Synechococcus phage S-PM2]CFW42423.1 gp2 [Synechococcus phage S-PM2]
MSQGFKSIQRNPQFKTPGTLFEKVSNLTKGEKRSVSWYRSAVKQISSSYKKDMSKFTRDERKSNEDGNVLRRYTKEGHLYMFEYKAKMKWLPYYDRFPLVYVIKSSQEEFWGANLHYLNPKKRILAVQKLLQGQIDIPKACFHKYIQNHVEGFLLDLASSEWDTAILLPTEDFVKNVGNAAFPYDKELVWEETNETYYDKIRARRNVKGYGKQSDIEMVK